MTERSNSLRVSPPVQRRLDTLVDLRGYDSREEALQSVIPEDADEISHSASWINVSDATQARISRLAGKRVRNRDVIDRFVTAELVRVEPTAVVDLEATDE